MFISYWGEPSCALYEPSIPVFLSSQDNSQAFLNSLNLARQSREGRDILSSPSAYISIQSSGSPTDGAYYD